MPLAQGGVALAIDNHLLAVTATKTASTGSWHAYETRRGPLFLSGLPQDRFVDLQQQQVGHGIVCY